MAAFQPGVPIETAEPGIVVEVDPNNPLPPGRHRFRLVVRDNDGLESQPDEVDIIVVDERSPTAVLDAPQRVLFGQNFEMSGKRSSDPAPGQIVAWEWTLLS